MPRTRLDIAPAPAPAARRRAACAAGAFTLIEVMLAVVIMGLGLLGISALFAGAAQQQRQSGDVNLSVAAARNAEALLARNFGRLAGESLDTSSTTTDKVLPGVWYAASTKLADVQGTMREPSLTVDIYGNGDLYYLSPDEPDFEVYSNMSPLVGAVGMEHPTAGMGVGWTDQFPGAPGPGLRLLEASVGPVRDIPRSRVHPDPTKLQVDVVVRQTGGPAAPPPITFIAVAAGFDSNKNFDTVVLQRAGTTPVVNADGEPCNFSGGQVATALQGFGEAQDFVVIHLGERYGPGVVPPPQNNPDLATVEVNLDPNGPNAVQSDQWIASITLRPYQWRDDTLVSLNDRMITQADDRFPDGRRPTLGYTVLFRTLAGASTSQITIFTYSLEPLSPPRVQPQGFSFIPPEWSYARRHDVGRLLRLADNDVKLGYDQTTSQYFVSVPDDDDHRWLVAPGQLLMMSESQDPMTLDPTGGSDVPVKVVAQLPDHTPGGMTNGRLRGVLDRGPRVDGRSALNDLDNQTNIAVWAMSPIVESQTPDRTEWRVRPVEARQFQIVTR